MQSFKVLVNKKKKWAISVGNRVNKLMISNGYLYRDDKPDYTIVVGGDGTLYHYLSQLSGKVILIGSETSFRAQLTRKNWQYNLLKNLQKKCIKLPILMIKKNRKIIGYAMNDIVFHTNNHKVVKIECKTEHNQFVMQGDGLIISTPFGSTAYSYSAGGNMLALNSKRLAITPICPCFRNLKPFTEQTKFVMIVSPENADLIIDGHTVLRKANGRFTVSYSKQNICFLAK